MKLTLNHYCYLLVCCVSVGQALSSDQKQVLNARSDSAEINQQSGVSIYLNNVYAVQGTTSLQADKVVTKEDSQHKLVEVIAYGNPAIYKTIPEAGKAELTATAQAIHYFPTQHYVQLIGDAIVIQDGNRYAAPQINYDTELQTVTSPARKEGRTTILLQPATFTKKP